MNSSRKHTRFDYETSINIELNGKKYEGKTINISIGGVFFATSQQFNYGAKVICHIQLPSTNNISAISGVIRWQKMNHGTGLQFEILRPIEVWAINKLSHQQAESSTS